MRNSLAKRQLVRLRAEPKVLTCEGRRLMVVGNEPAAPDPAGRRDSAAGPEPAAPGGQLERGSPAYLWNRRVQVSYDIAIACALVTAVTSIIGYGTALSGRTSIVDLAQSATRVLRPGLAYVAGPVIVLLALPVFRGGIRVRTVLNGSQPGSSPLSGGSWPDAGARASGTALIEAISAPMLVRDRLHWRLRDDADRRDIVRFSFRGRYWARLLLTVLGWLGGIAVHAYSLADLRPAYTVSPGSYLLGVLLSVGLVATLVMWPTGLETARVIGQPTQRAAWVSRVATQ